MDKKEHIKIKISLLNHRRKHLTDLIRGPALGWGDCHERRSLIELANSVDEKINYLESLLEERKG